MTTTHETGHVVGGWISGGTLQEASLAPWGLPHSRFEPDPRPLVTLWSGPVLGVVGPLLVAVIVRRPAAWFVAHFCILANGCYLALAWMTGDNHLDTPRLLAAGCPIWVIVAYCLVTITGGYIGFRRACVRVLTPVPNAFASASPPA
jgi:hypothetical protein